MTAEEMIAEHYGATAKQVQGMTNYSFVQGGMHAARARRENTIHFPTTPDGVRKMIGRR